jgi:glycosyltransferase involved in cell wall biosynthesis
MKISVIVTTYNWPSALRAVLNALVAQKTSCNFEIIVADDGSDQATATMIRDFIEAMPNSISILHIWQPDEGFRAAQIRNKAIVAAAGEYIIFLDGDCIPRENFIARHQALAKAEHFVVGNRILLNREFTQEALSKALALHGWSFWDWCRARVKRYCNRIFPLISVPKIIHFNRSWKGAKGCNLGVWKADLLRVNGWEEKFSGWGYEDSDLVIRLLKSGVRRRDGHFYVPVIHLWHSENDRSQESKNWALLESRKNDVKIFAERGLDQYA